MTKPDSVRHARRRLSAYADLSSFLVADDLRVLLGAEKRLREFITEIAEDDWYAHGADHTDVQTAARRLLGLEADPYA